jgi:hypothetical protein
MDRHDKQAFSPCVTKELCEMTSKNKEKTREKKAVLPRSDKFDYEEFADTPMGGG